MGYSFPCRIDPLHGVFLFLFVVGVYEDAGA